MFEPGSLAGFAAAYPETPVLFAHQLTVHPLLALPRLTVLAGTLPPHSVICRPGDVPVDGHDAAVTTDGTAALRVQTLEINNSLVELRNAQQDQDFNSLTQRCLRPIRPLLKTSTGRIIAPAMDLALASPHAVAPFHMRAEYILYLQTRGTQRIFVFPRDTDGVVDTTARDRLYRDGDGRLSYNEDIEDLAISYELNEGDALYLPPETPHWRLAGDGLSITALLKWHSPATIDDRDDFALYRWLRRAGIPLSSPQGHRFSGLRARLFRRLQQWGLAPDGAKKSSDQTESDQ